MSPRKWISIFSLYLIFFIDIAGLAVVYVFFAPMILKSSSSMVSSALSLESRNMILVLLFAVYPFSQLFGAPIFGELSDRFGRKKILLLTAIASALGFFFSAVSIWIESLALLFLSRFFTGFFAGNTTVAQATVASMVSKEKVGRYMAIFTSIGGFGWIVGPYAGVLLDKISTSFPFVFVSCIFLLTFFLFLVFLDRDSAQEAGEKLSMQKTFGNILRVFTYPKVAFPLIISILIINAWMMYQGFFSTYLIRKYELSVNTVGYIFVYFAAWWMIGGLIANRFILTRFKASGALIIPQIASGASIFLLVFTSGIWAVWVGTALSNLLQAAGLASFFALFSILEKHQNLGKVFGCWNAGLALGSAIGPILAGGFAYFGINTPYLFAAIFLILPVLFYIKWYRKKGRDLEIDSLKNSE